MAERQREREYWLMQRLDGWTWHIGKSKKFCNKFCKVLLKTTPLPKVLWIVPGTGF